MSDLTALTDRYFEMWNETNRDRRRKLIAEIWTDAPSYVDPVGQGEGRDGIDEMVAGVQERFPDHRLNRTSPIDAHNGRLRFNWELAPEGGEALVKGVDFGIVVGDRLHMITGFFDQVPAPSAP
jgi:hypothetical protein